MAFERLLDREAQIHLVGFNREEVLHRPSPRVLEGRCRHYDVAGKQFLGLNEGTIVTLTPSRQFL